MVKPLISIVTPTFNRESMLSAIHRCVLDQSYGNWEWIILDDSAQPSAYFLAQHDPRIRYHHVGIRQCVGDKRNWLNGQARGATTMFDYEVIEQSSHRVEYTGGQLVDHDNMSQDLYHEKVTQVWPILKAFRSR